MRRSGLFATFGILIGLLLPLAAHAGPLEELSDAENWFLYGNFDKVVEKLSPLVEPKSQLADRKDLGRSYELLGLSSFYLRHEPDARKYFERLIRLDPDHQLDPLVVPPPAIRFFTDLHDSLRAELEKQKEALQRELREEDERRRRANLVIERVELVRNNRLVAAIPFGIGQFQNEDMGLGTAFLACEVALTGASVGFYLAVSNLRQPTGRFAHTDMSRAQTYQALQLATGIGALLAVAGGILQAELTFRENTAVSRQVYAPGTGPTGVVPESSPDAAPAQSPPSEREPPPPRPEHESPSDPPATGGGTLGFQWQFEF